MNDQYSFELDNWSWVFKLDSISKHGMKSTVWTYIYTLIQKDMIVNRKTSYK